MNRRPFGRFRRHGCFAAPLLAVSLVATAYGVDPSGRVSTMFHATVLILLMGLGAGPLVRGARPLQAWWGVPVGATALVLALLCRHSSVMVGPLTLADVFYLAGYGSFAAWFVLLIRYAGRELAVRALLDTAAATVGTALALWTVTDVGSHVDAWNVATWVLYPVLDVIVLFLAGHLAVRLGRPVPAWWWVFAGLVLQLVLDVLYGLGHLAPPDGQPSALTAPFLFVYFLLAVGATHPSVVALARARDMTVDHPAAGHGALISLMVAVLPSVLVMAAPMHDVQDVIVRSFLVGLLLCLLFLRLAATMRALSKAEAASRHRASHDVLTGLPNRHALFRLLDHRLAAPATGGRTTAVLLLDCDDFKDVNDTWGHQAGDTLLRAIASGLPRTLGPMDFIARHGGDEFVVVTEATGPGDAELVAASIQRFFARPIQIRSDRAHAITPSIGIALATPGQSADDLIGRADLALYEAKRRGRAQYVVYDEELESRGRVRAMLAVALRRAIEEESLTIALQPVMTGVDYGIIAGWEALARWEDPVTGHVPPDIFIPLAEELGVIDDLGAFVLRTACRDLARLRAAAPAARSAIVSVNVSASQLRRADFADTVRDALAAASLPGDALWLEVTESQLVERRGTVIETLERLRQAGVRITLDDFGTGYAALSTLFRLPVDVVKLDRSLLRSIGEARSEDFIPSLLRLLRSAGIDDIVAEGIETREQAADLARMGCPMAQGWHFGRPAPVSRILQTLAVDAQGTAVTLPTVDPV